MKKYETVEVEIVYINNDIVTISPTEESIPEEFNI